MFLYLNVEAGIQYGEKLMHVVIREGANSALYISSLGLFPEVGIGPRGMMLKFRSLPVVSKTRIVANDLKSFKQLVRDLSKPESELTQQELKQLERLTEKFGGKLRYDLNPVKGKILKPHVQVGGRGSSIEARHIWLGKGVQ